MTTDPASGQRLETYLYAHIPLVRSLQLKVESWDADGLRLSAPLAPNINHEGTAFGGSLEILTTLACWGLLWLQLEQQPATHIVVAEARMRFLRPVQSALQAQCALPDTASLQTFLDTLQHHHKARIELQSRIVADGETCASFTGRFVAHQAGPHVH